MNTNIEYRLGNVLNVLTGRDVAARLHRRSRVRQTRSDISKRAFTVLMGLVQGKSFRQSAREAGYSEAYLRKRPQRIMETCRKAFWEQQIEAEKVASAINLLFDAMARLEPLENAEDTKAEGQT